MTKVLKHYPELGLSVEHEVHDYHVEFRVRESCQQLDGSYDYEFEEEGGAITSTPDFEKSCRYIDGSVKWDGCSHLNFGEGLDNPGYLHLCGASSFNRLREALRIIFATAAAELPTFNHNVAR